MRPVIELHGISKKYRLGRIGSTSIRDSVERTWNRLRGNNTSQKTSHGDFWALRDLSFTIQPGEMVGIIGQNGAGKSTLLKILSRITEPTKGEALLRGRPASLLQKANDPFTGNRERQKDARQVRVWRWRSRFRLAVSAGAAASRPSP